MYSIFEYSRSGELFQTKDNEKSVPCLSYGVRRVTTPPPCRLDNSFQRLFVIDGVAGPVIGSKMSLPIFAALRRSGISPSYYKGAKDVSLCLRWEHIESV